MRARSLSRRRLLGLGGATLAAAHASGAPGHEAPFPRGFLWGTATAAYQIEGAARVDGRGESVWDVFSRKPGAVFEGHTGDVACDHYHRWREDVALMSALGSNAYRFSVGWPHVLPDGVGAPSQAGLDFYDRLVDALLAAHLQPMCTLFHWDFPQRLYERGGWRNRDAAAWFAEYATLVARRLSDRVRLWVTQNEPQVFMTLGHLQGTHAPGDKLPLRAFLEAGHNVLRAHGRGVQAIRAAARGAVSVGYVVATAPCEPASDEPGDLEAARTAQWRVAIKDGWSQSWWLDPILRGRYPEDGLALFGADAPRPAARDLDEIKQPIDFLGLNIYTSTVWRRGPDGRPREVAVPVGYPRSAVDWQPLRPSALYWGPRHFHERFGLPLYVTESGLATRDQVFLDGQVHDPQRVDYLHRALLELARGLRAGADVRGWFAWSLLDNYEWADGYKQRFGLVYVDFPTGQRLPKDSYHWYRRVIASGGRALLGKTALPPHVMTPP